MILNIQHGCDQPWPNMSYHNTSFFAINFTCGFSISFLLWISFSSRCLDSILPALTRSEKNKFNPIKVLVALKFRILPLGMAAIVFVMTAWSDAIVFSNANCKFVDKLLCAKNNDANRSPVPVKLIPLPCFGIDNEQTCRCLSVTNVCLS